MENENTFEETERIVSFDAEQSELALEVGEYPTYNESDFGTSTDYL